MKNLIRIIVALCLVMALLATVACVGKKNYDDHEESLDLGDSGLAEVTTPGDDTEEPASEDAYINAAPANDEQGWGELTPAPGK